MDAPTPVLNHLQPCSGIRGVVDVRQHRSLVARNALIEAGMSLLNAQRFDELTVAALARAGGQSVGGFYARFEDKDAFFRALCVTAVDNCDVMVEDRFSAEVLASQSAEQVLDTLVDLMTDIFTAPWRGVLREALLRILEPEDPWELMRASARRIVVQLESSASRRTSDTTPDHVLRFCFQMVVGVLQNDLLNDYHVYTTQDQSLRQALKKMVRAYARDRAAP